MEIYVERDTFTPCSTIGRMFCGGVFECFTLEPPVRPSGVKVTGQTAIPEGRYRVTIDFSEKFQRSMPLVNDVPGFDGIRIHIGNTARETEGCTLVGTTHGVDVIINSKLAFETFFAKLENWLKMGEVWITYQDVRSKEDAQLGLGLEAAA